MKNAIEYHLHQRWGQNVSLRLKVGSTEAGQREENPRREESVFSFRFVSSKSRFPRFRLILDHQMAKWSKNGTLLFVVVFVFHRRRHRRCCCRLCHRPQRSRSGWR